MSKLFKLIIVSFSLILFVILLLLFLNQNNKSEFQNQYLRLFGVDFIQSDFNDYLQNDYGTYIKIELNSNEQNKIEKQITSSKRVFLSTDNEKYEDFFEYVNRYFTLKKVLDVNGYFSFYNSYDKTFNSIENYPLEFVFVQYSDGIIYVYHCDA